MKLKDGINIEYTVTIACGDDKTTEGSMTRGEAIKKALSAIERHRRNIEPDGTDVADIFAGFDFSVKVEKQVLFFNHGRFVCRRQTKQHRPLVEVLKKKTILEYSK